MEMEIIIIWLLTFSVAMFEYTGTILFCVAVENALKFDFLPTGLANQH